MKKWYMIVVAIAIVILVWVLMSLRIDTTEYDYTEYYTIGGEYDENNRMYPKL